MYIRYSGIARKPPAEFLEQLKTLNTQLSLGQLLKCRVWHDNKGFGASWHCAQVEVEDSHMGQKFVFPCNRWLSKSEDDKQIVRELSCANVGAHGAGAKDKISKCASDA